MEVMDIEFDPLRGEKNGGEKKDPSREKKEDPKSLSLMVDVSNSTVSTPPILTTIVRILDVVVKSGSKFTHQRHKFFRRGMEVAFRSLNHRNPPRFIILVLIRR